MIFDRPQKHCRAILYGMMILIVAWSGPRPIIHTHTDLAESTFDRTLVDKHLQAWHPTSLDQPIDPDAVHLHWLLNCMEAAFECYDLCSDNNAPAVDQADALRVEKLPSPIVEIINPRMCDGKSRALSACRRHASERLPAGVSVLEFICVLQC